MYTKTSVVPSSCSSVSHEAGVKETHPLSYSGALMNPGGNIWLSSATSEALRVFILVNRYASRSRSEAFKLSTLSSKSRSNSVLFIGVPFVPYRVRSATASYRSMSPSSS